VLLFLFPSRALALWPKNTVGGNYYRKIKTPELGVDHSSGSARKFVRSHFLSQDAVIHLIILSFVRKRFLSRSDTAFYSAADRLLEIVLISDT
jgi:hypothetical protein